MLVKSLHTEKKKHVKVRVTGKAQEMLLKGLESSPMLVCVAKPADVQNDPTHKT